MTRINVVPPQELCDQHLLAEYRELPRVFTLAIKWHQERYDPDRLPKKYTMGKGHVRFFYHRLFFLKKRYQTIVAELEGRRGFQLNDQLVASVLGTKIPPQLMGDLIITQRELAINRARIAERLSTMKTQPKWSKR